VGPAPEVEDSDSGDSVRVLCAREPAANSEQADSDSKSERSESLSLPEPGSFPTSISGMDSCCVFGSGLMGAAAWVEEGEDGLVYREDLEAKVDN